MKQFWVTLGLGIGLMLAGGASGMAQVNNQNAASQVNARQQGALGVSLREAGGRLRVSSVVAGSPAAVAGIRVGDEIVSVDGQGVGTAGQLIAAVVTRQPGSQLNVGIRRNGQRQNIVANLVSVDAIRNLSANVASDHVTRQIRALQRQVSLLEQAVRESRQTNGAFQGNGDNDWYYQDSPDDPNQGIHDYGARARDGQ